MAIYAKHCSTIGCTFVIKAEAATDGEAMPKMVEAAKVHIRNAHPQVVIPSDDQLAEEIKASWYKEA
jgi:predicted small metal-binding protein